MLKHKSKLVICYPCVRKFKSFFLSQNGYRTDKLEQSLHKSFRSFHSSGRGMSHARAWGEREQKKRRVRRGLEKEKEKEKGGGGNPDIEPRNLTARLHYKCCKTRVSPKCRRRNEYHL